MRKKRKMRYGIAPIAEGDLRSRIRQIGGAGMPDCICKRICKHERYGLAYN